MKFLVLILGSTTLVAGGTAITSQQDSRNNVIANQLCSKSISCCAPLTI